MGSGGRSGGVSEKGATGAGELKSTASQTGKSSPEIGFCQRLGSGEKADRGTATWFNIARSVEVGPYRESRL